MDDTDLALVELGQALRNHGYRFITPTPLTHRRVNQRPENQLAHDLAGVFGWSRPFSPAWLPPELFSLMQQAGIAAPCEPHWCSRLRLSSLAGELFWHSAFPTEATDVVFFGPDTYRFAQAIEALLTRGSSAPASIVDVGCGSGAGAILAARLCPQAEVRALDINPAALRLTRVNAQLAGVQVHALHSDLLQALTAPPALILANPPYLLDPRERAYRHGGGPLGAGLSLAILDQALDRLAPGGALLLYTGAAMQAGHDPFHQAVASRLEGRDWPWSYRELDPDVFGEELLTGPYLQCERIAAVLLEVHRPR